MSMSNPAGKPKSPSAVRVSRGRDGGAGRGVSRCDRTSRREGASMENLPIKAFARVCERFDRAFAGMPECHVGEEGHSSREIVRRRRADREAWKPDSDYWLG